MFSSINSPKKKTLAGFLGLLGFSCISQVSLAASTIDSGTAVNVTGGDDISLITSEADSGVDPNNNDGGSLTLTTVDGGDISLSSDGNITLTGTNGISITGTTTINNDLDVDGATTTDGINNDGDISTTNDISIGNDMSIGNDLGVGGDTSITGTLDVNGATTTDGITNDGDISTTNDMSIGNDLSVTRNASITGNLDVDGATTVDDFTAVGTVSITGTSTINTSGVSATTFGTNGNTTNLNSSVVNIGAQAYTTAVSIGSAQTNTTVTARGGNSTLSVQDNVASLTSSSNGFSTYTNGQVIGTDYTLVNGNAASQALVTGQTTSNVLVGNTLVDGDMYINGTLTYTSSTSATTTVTSGVSELPGATQATIGVVRVDNSGGVSVDSNGKISPNGATGPTAGVVLTNGYGETHGLAVTESQVTLSGGTRSSSLTLDNNGATFSNSNTGLPVQIHGVADGTTAFDAVNYRQLVEVKRGLAATTAMTNIPAIDTNKKFSIGIGLGGYDEETAFALGSSMRLEDNFILKASVGRSFGGETSSSNTTWGVGSSFSW